MSQPPGTPTRAEHAPMPEALATLLSHAQAAGLLPPGAKAPASEQRPWPLVLLTALGAWLSAIPLMGVVGLLLGDMIIRSLGPYLVGTLLLVAALVLLRARYLPVFVEQLAIPALLTGGGALGFGLFRDLPAQLAAGALCLIALGYAAVVAQAWLRGLLGAAAALLLMVALIPHGRWVAPGHPNLSFWLAAHGAVAAWFAALLLQHRVLGGARGAWTALVIEHIGAGWLLATVAALAWQSGTTFLLGGAMGSGFARELAGAVNQEVTYPTLTGSMFAAGSMLLAVAASARIASAWPGLRQLPCAGVALVLAVLCGFLPMLGAVLLVLSATCTTRRWRLAMASATAAAWIVGSFYYQLAWPLATKAALLVAAAAALGALAWWAQGAMAQAGRTPTRDATYQPTQPSTLPDGGPDAHPPSLAGGAAMAHIASRRVPVLLATTGIAVLLVANIGIWQKEDTIAHGQPLYVPLAPMDPRSLMQADYMRLRFALPAALQGELASLVSLQRPQVVARRDPRGVAILLRIHKPQEPLAEGEFRIELSPKNGQWILVSDAWFFREGEGTRFAQARFGEFRVAPDGRALLVGMADAELRQIAP